jgi:hypothetical protein
LRANFSIIVFLAIFGGQLLEDNTSEEIMMKWEKLKSNIYGMKRSKVPGGWLVLAYGSGITIYPDPEHK